VLGGLARHVLVPGVMEGEKDFSYFLVETNGPGVKAGPPVFSLGLHACPAVDIQFTDARGELAGNLGQGAAYLDAASDEMAVASAAMSLGIMQGAFKYGRDYARKRFQGGRQIIGWSEVRMMLANMAAQAKVAQLALSRACQAVDDKEARWREASRATCLWVQEMACAVATDGIQVLGGVGYMKDYPQEKRFRDAKHAQALLGIAPMRKLALLNDLMV